MATNKTSRDTIVVASIAVALLVVISANLLADRKFGRIDLTAEKRYSLSQPFRNILGRLKDPAKITYYVSGSVPAGFENVKRDILDKLKEIEMASDGKIELEPIDPTGDEELCKQLREKGCELRAQDAKKDQLSLSLLYTAIKLTYRDKAAVYIPRVVNSEDLEYQLGSEIVKLTQDKKPVIAIMTPPAPQQPPQMFGGQKPQGSGYEWITQGQVPEFEKFGFKTVDITENNNIPDGTSLLVLIRPKELNERQRYEVVKYLAGGGKVLLIANSFKIASEFGWRAEKTPTGLEEYLKEAGVTFGDDFVFDNSNLEMPKSINLFNGQVEYDRLPFFVRITPDNIDQESVLTRLMPNILMPMPGSMKLDNDSLKKNGLTASVLAKTTKQSWGVPFNPAFDPEKLRQYDPEKQQYDGSKNVFAIIEGQFPFPYEGKPVPSWNKTPPEDPKDKEAKKDEKKDDKGEVAKVTIGTGSLLVFTCPEAFHMMYLSNQRLGQEFQQNILLLMNVLENYSMGNDLLQIRTKTYATRSIDKKPGKENDATRFLIKLALVLGAPIAVALFAIGRFIIRRSNQANYERKFAQTIGPSSFTP